MDNSIINASKNSQGLNRYFSGRNKFISIGVLLVVLSGLFVYGYAVNNRSDNELAVKKIETSGKKTSLQISIAADGRLVADKNTELLFSSAGTIKDIYVKDGQAVKKGDKIASLDTAELELVLAGAKTSKSIAVANLLSRQAGPSQFDVELVKKNISLAEKRLADIKKQNSIDIKNAELALRTAQLNLESAKNELSGNTIVGGLDSTSLDLKIAQAYDDAIVKTALSYTTVENSLKEANNVLAVRDDGLSDVLGALNSSARISADDAYNATLSLKIDYHLKYQNIKTGSSRDLISEKLIKSIALAESSSQMIHKVSLALEATITSSQITQAELDGFKDAILNEHAKIKGQIEVLNNAKQAIDTAMVDKQLKDSSGDNLTVSNEAKINLAIQQYEGVKLQLENARAKATVNESEAQNQLEVAKIQLSLKTEPVRDVDVASLRAQITQTQNQIDEAQYRLSLSTIVAPINGIISGINGKPGDIFADKNKVFAIIVNKDNFSVEAYVEEADIAKIKNKQKAYLTFDALDGIKLEGLVDFISDVPTIDANGLVTYLVRTVIVDRKDAEIKDGMTTYVEFILAEAKNVLTLPVAAIKNINGKSSVALSNGDAKVVETGFTDGKLVEIISGLEAADKVLYAE